MEIPNLKKRELTYLIQRSPQPVLVDFWANGCVPCKFIEQALKEIANEMRGQIRVCRVNLTENMDIAKDFNILTVPTLLIIKRGRVQERITGLQSKSEILKRIASL